MLNWKLLLQYIHIFVRLTEIYLLIECYKMEMVQKKKVNFFFLLIVSIIWLKLNLTDMLEQTGRNISKNMKLV